MTAATRLRTGFGRETGMSLVELMVGMMVGLIGIVIIAHLYITNEQYKRSTEGAGTAQANGAVALYTLERDIRMAGFGFNNANALGCTCVGAGCSPIQYYYSGSYSSPPAPAGPGALPPFTMVPVKITETAGAPDQIAVLYSTSDQRALPTTLSSTMPSPSAILTANGALGYNANDLIIVANGSTCALMQITSVTASQIQHNSGASNWNPPGGGSLLPAFTSGSYVFDLGTPRWRTYSVANSALQLTESMQDPSVAPTTYNLVDNVVDLQAQYGKDTNNDGTVDVWDTTDPTTSAGWMQIIAIRVGVLAQSPNYVRPSVLGGNCDATTTANAPTWAGGAFTLDFATATSQARCYKYRVFDTIVPLRNIIWK